jgi:hypothetical protein
LTPRATTRGVLAALALAFATTAAAYLPPATAILKRVVQRRDDLKLSSLEVRATLALSGDDARRAADVAGLPAPVGDLTVPAVLLVKVPGRCRLELAPDGVAPAARPAVWTRGGRIVGQRGLDGVATARALLEGVCTLIAERGSGGVEPERALARRLAALGVALTDVGFGRLGARPAWVIGGRPRDPRPQAWFDKQALQPARLLAPLAGAPRDIRLVDFGTPPGGDAFPRTVEMWGGGGQIEARLTAEKVTQNPKISDASF